MLDPSGNTPSRVGATLASGALALFLVVPFILPFNTSPLPTFYQEWTAILLGCAVFIVAAWQQRASVWAIPRIVWLPVGICALLLIQGGMGRWGYWQQGVTAVFYLAWAGVMMIAGQLLRACLGWERLCVVATWALCIGAVLSALFGLLQFLGWRVEGVVMPIATARMHGNLAQSNLFASYLCIGLFSVCCLVANRRMHAACAAAAVMLLLVGAHLSGQRAVWAYLLSGLLLAGLTFHQSRSRNAKALTIWVAGVVAAMLLLAAALTAVLHDGSLFGMPVPRHETGYERMIAGHGGVSQRKSTWLAAWRMFEDAPVSGVGYGAFAWNYFLSKGQLPAGLPEEIVDNAHNILLHLLAEFGLPGALLLIVATGLWLFACLREWWCRKPHEQSAGDVFGWWLFALLCVIVLHSLIEYPLWYAHFLGMFALMVGAGDAAAWQLRFAGSNAKTSLPVAVMVAGILMLSMLATVFVDYRRVEQLGMQSAAGGGNRQVAIAAARISQTSLFGHVVELGLSRTIALDDQALDAKLELNGRVLRAFPAPDVAFRQSALLALRGDLDAAYRLWDLSAAAYPVRAVAVADVLARASAGEKRLEPLVEYAASRQRREKE